MLLALTLDSHPKLFSAQSILRLGKVTGRALSAYLNLTLSSLPSVTFVEHVQCASMFPWGYSHSRSCFAPATTLQGVCCYCGAGFTGEETEAWAASGHDKGPMADVQPSDSRLGHLFPRTEQRVPDLRANGHRVTFLTWPWPEGLITARVISQEGSGAPLQKPAPSPPPWLLGKDNQLPLRAEAQASKKKEAHLASCSVWTC